MESIVVVRTKRVAAAKARQQIEGHRLSSRCVREQPPAVQGQHQLLTDDRNNLQSFGVIAPETELSEIAIRIGAEGCPIQSSRSWMAAMIAVVGADGYVSMEIGGGLRDASVHCEDVKRVG